jgi:hypothetical protein
MDNVWLHRIALLIGIALAWLLFEKFGDALKRKWAAGSIGG